MSVNPMIALQSPTKIPDDVAKALETSATDDKEHAFYSKFLDETPIPGYQGYIPLMCSTRAALGVPFTEAVRRSVQEFKQMLEEIRLSKTCSDFGRPVSQSKKMKVFDITETVPVPGYQGYVPLLWRTKASVGVGYSKAVLQSMKEFRELTSSSPPQVTPQVLSEPSKPAKLEITDQDKKPKASNQIFSTANRIPISGYQGFVPFLWTTGTGVGLCFTEAVLRCMADFRAVQEKNKLFEENLKSSIVQPSSNPQNKLLTEDLKSSTVQPNSNPPSSTTPKSVFTSERLPIPGYQGFVPLWQTTSSLGVSFTEAVLRSMRDFREMQAKKA